MPTKEIDRSSYGKLNRMDRRKFIAGLLAIPAAAALPIPLGLKKIKPKWEQVELILHYVVHEKDGSVSESKDKLLFDPSIPRVKWLKDNKLGLMPNKGE